MPIINFPDYADHISQTVNNYVATSQAKIVSLKLDHRSALRGFITGVLRFNDNSELHFREFVDMSRPESRLMYAYHYQDVNNTLIFRYDNAAHRPPLSQREHKHTPAGVMISHAPTLVQVLDEILPS